MALNLWSRGVATVLAGIVAAWSFAACGGVVAPGEEGCETLVAKGEWVVELGRFGGLEGLADLYVVRADGHVDLYHANDLSFVRTLPGTGDAASLAADIDATGALSTDPGCYDVGYDDSGESDGSNFVLAVRKSGDERYFEGHDGGSAPDEVVEARGIAQAYVDAADGL